MPGGGRSECLRVRSQVAGPPEFRLGEVPGLISSLPLYLILGEAPRLGDPADRKRAPRKSVVEAVLPDFYLCVTQVRALSGLA